MTNSMIPYSFIPGTKAKAGEVNANFVAFAEAYFGTEGDRDHRLPEGCGWFPSDQCRPYVHRSSLLCIGHSEWYSGTAEALSHRNSGKEMCGIGTQQHCG